MVTESLPGDYTVSVLDTAGKTVAQVTVPVSFDTYVEPLGLILSLWN